MQFTSTLISILLTSSLSSALPVEKRTAATVLSAISSISSDVATLTSDATSYTGGLFQSLALAITVDELESSITSGTSDATGSTAFDTTDSASVLAAVTTLTPKIVTLLTDLDAKGIQASTISSAGYTSVVLSALKKLETDTDAFFVAVEALLNSSDAASLVTLQGTVDTAFTSAIADF